VIVTVRAVIGAVLASTRDSSLYHPERLFEIVAVTPPPPVLPPDEELDELEEDELLDELEELDDELEELEEDELLLDEDELLLEEELLDDELLDEFTVRLTAAV